MPRCHACSLIFLFLIAISLGACSESVDPVMDLDPTAPFPVTDLALTTSRDTTFLTWTATGDDGPNGTASRYDLRQHPVMITEENWTDAAPLENLPSPREARSAEWYVLAVGTPPPTAYMAIKVVDDHGNVSKMSNIVYSDLTPPAAVTDLATTRVTDSYAALAWTTPPDDGPLGSPKRYQIRWGLEELTQDNWFDETPINGPSRPVEAGVTQPFTLTGLSPLNHYFVAVRSLDESGNLSAISNVIEFDTPATPKGWWNGFADLQINGSVESLESLGETLYVGGRFLSVNGTVAMGIAAWDGVDWSSLGGGLTGGYYGTLVLNLESIGEDLYVGGSFNYAGGNLAPNIARWTGSAWEGLGNPQTSGHPWSMGVHSGQLYVGWIFNNLSRWPFEHLSRFDGTSFDPMGWDSDDHHTPAVILEYGGKLVLGGGFSSPNGPPSSPVLMWDGLTYTAPEPILTGGYWGYGVLTALCEFQGDLIAGGEFSHAGETEVNNIARWDGSRWHPLGGGLAGERPLVGAMTVYRGYLVVGGNFDRVDGIAANNIALWDGTYWTPMGDGLELSEGYGNIVNDLEVHAGSLYVGGTFETAGGNPSPGIARWDLD